MFNVVALKLHYPCIVKAFIEENHNEVNPTATGRKMSDSRSVPIVKNLEPDHLEERIKKELVSLGLCDEAEVIRMLLLPCNYSSCSDSWRVNLMRTRFSLN